MGKITEKLKHIGVFAAKYGVPIALCSITGGSAGLATIIPLAINFIQKKYNFSSNNEINDNIKDVLIDKSEDAIEELKGFIRNKRIISKIEEYAKEIQEVKDLMQNEFSEVHYILNEWYREYGKQMVQNRELTNSQLNNLKNDLDSKLDYVIKGQSITHGKLDELKNKIKRQEYLLAKQAEQMAKQEELLNTIVSFLQDKGQTITSETRNDLNSVLNSNLGEEQEIKQTIKILKEKEDIRVKEKDIKDIWSKIDTKYGLRYVPIIDYLFNKVENLILFFNHFDIKSVKTLANFKAEDLITKILKNSDYTAAFDEAWNYFFPFHDEFSKLKYDLKILDLKMNYILEDNIDDDDLYEMVNEKDYEHLRNLKILYEVYMESGEEELEKRLELDELEIDDLDEIYDLENYDIEAEIIDLNNEVKNLETINKSDLKTRLFTMIPYILEETNRLAKHPKGVLTYYMLD